MRNYNVLIAHTGEKIGTTARIPATGGPPTCRW